MELGPLRESAGRDRGRAQMSGLRHSSNSGAGRHLSRLLVGEQEPREREPEGVISEQRKRNPASCQGPAFPQTR